MKSVIYKFNQLNTDSLYDVLQLREAVFIVEQQCAYADLDDKDRHPETRHLMVLSATDELIAYARLLAPNTGYSEASIGRVIVASCHRGQGLAARLITRAIALTQEYWPHAGIQIAAQAYLLKFYRQLGFVVCSEVYLEDGIEHIHMRYSLNA